MNRPDLIRMSYLDDEAGKTIYVFGVLKRIEAKRLRFFDKEYHEAITKKGDRGDRRLFSEEDVLEIEDYTGKIKITVLNQATMNGAPIK